MIIKTITIRGTNNNNNNNNNNLWDRVTLGCVSSNSYGSLMLCTLSTCNQTLLSMIIQRPSDKFLTFLYLIKRLNPAKRVKILIKTSGKCTHVQIVIGIFWKGFHYRPVVVISNSASIVTFPSQISDGVKRNLFVLIDKHLRKQKH